MSGHLDLRATELDLEHAGTDLRSRFVLPDGVTYLDGNSLGALPVGVEGAVRDAVVRQWGHDLVDSWNTHAWWDAPARVGEVVARIVGAAPGQVVVGDTTSLRWYQVLHAAAAMRPGRRLVLADPASFPTDLYVLSGVAAQVGWTVELVPPDDAPRYLAKRDVDVAAVAYSHVDYRTGRVWDLPGVTVAAHDAGALALWDLCHSAGALPVRLDDAGVDLAVGCGYKYLNGGPGAPAFVYVASRHLGSFENPVRGWHGHAEPFAMAPEYAPAADVTRARTGTPHILSLVALEAALRVFEGVDVASVRARSLSLTRFLRDALEDLVPGVDVTSPADDAQRGSQVAVRHEAAYGIVRALHARGVVADFRTPDVVRLGVAAPYLTHADMLHAVRQLVEVLEGREHLDPAYAVRAKVT
jgi:kynureninase